MSNEPEGLVSMVAAGSAIGSGIVAARDRGPSDDDVRALEAALFMALAVPVAAAASTATTTSAPSAVSGAAASSAAAPSTWLAAAGLKLTVVALAGAAAIGGGAAWWHGRSEARADATPATTSPTAGAVPRTVVPAGGPAMENPLPAVPPPVAIEGGEVAGLARGPGATKVASATHAARLRRGTVPAAARPPERDAQPQSVEELRLLERARQALVARPALALDLADQHARRFSNRALDQEREVIAVTALLNLGRGDEARARARAFLNRFPGSAHEARIRAVVAKIAPRRL